MAQKSYCCFRAIGEPNNAALINPDRIIEQQYVHSLPNFIAVYQS